MTKGRVEAFSDGVVAIIITIMVLELKVPHGEDLESLRPLAHDFLAYVLSFLYVGIYWNNHHHMLHATHKVNGRILWCNQHLLFWLSLVPFSTAWMGDHPRASLPNAVYGGVLLMCAIAYTILQNAILAEEPEGSHLRTALGRDRKGKASLALYVAAIPLAFVSPLLSGAIYVTVASVWLIPDRRIESKLQHDG